MVRGLLITMHIACMAVRIVALFVLWALDGTASALRALGKQTGECTTISPVVGNSHPRECACGSVFASPVVGQIWSRT